VNEEKTIVILKLYEPACQLAPFCPEANENYVKIVFNHNLSRIFSFYWWKLWKKHWGTDFRVYQL